MPDALRWLLPLQNPIGFGAADYLELILAVLLVCFVMLRPVIEPAAARFAVRTRWAMLLLLVLPIALRLMLLPNHPVPLPGVYDEFGHLLVADTLRHFRLANPMHPMRRFFETFFVLQEPTYSSIYPLGQGLLLATGRLLFHSSWAAVVLASGAFCSLCYWMLRAWVSPGLALLGGLLAVIEFGPLNPWTNCYWGGTLAACAGCLVFGSLPRIGENGRRRGGIALGLGLAIHVLTRPYESLFLLLSAGIFFASIRRAAMRPLAVAASFLLGAGFITLVQNRSITGDWLRLPYQLSQYQYGVPASLTFQAPPTPHRELTPQQRLEYQSQLSFRNSSRETAASYLLRLEYRVRFYRFFFLAPLYVALAGFAAAWRSPHWLWIVGTTALFALGTNFYPFFQVHYIAALSSLFILMSVRGLERLSEWRAGSIVATLAVFFCAAHFILWYTVHLFENNEVSPAMRRYETWNGINHRGGSRRERIGEELARIQGPLLVFVRYAPQHVFQDEWVYNEADIDGARIVWARDLGAAEDERLIRYYPHREVLLLDPDADPPDLAPYRPEPVPETNAPVPSAVAPKAPTQPAKKPTLRFEDVK